MKKKIYLALFLLSTGLVNLFAQNVSQCLISSGVVTGNCGVIGDAYIESSCIAGIQKQIARSVNAEGLVDWITPAKCWGYIGINGTPYDENLIPPATTPVNCTPPYDRCYGSYCPDKYCDIVKNFVDLKASFILRAANNWTNNSELKPGTEYYKGMKQIIIDINAAYDCAGLTRPVIQGSIFENIEEGVSNVPIPPDVILAFKNVGGFDNSYYLNVLGIPKSLNFSKSRIRNSVNSYWSDCPDITRIEAKMWFYYLAKLQIDLGYKSLHMGQMNGWAAQDVNFVSSTLILNLIRSYAQSKNTFVLLTEENNRARKFLNSNTFMFDFDCRAIRAREISNPQVCGDFDCTNTPLNYLINTPCSNEPYPAVIDACVLSKGGNESGISPTNGCSLPFQPFVTYFDFSNGDYSPVGVASSWCDGKLGTWGWDDTKWFSTKISQNCRAYWIADAICRLRQYYNGFGFMSAPGILAVLSPGNSSNYLQGLNPTAGGKYLISDELLVKNAVKQAWAVNENPGITTGYTCESKIGLCDPFNFKKIRVYHFSISSPDCTSTYTWHIKNPDNSWQPMVYGNKRDIAVNVAGNYTIYLNVDNLGLPNRGLQFSVTRFLTPTCCEGILSLNKSEIPSNSGQKENESQKLQAINSENWERSSELLYSNTQTNLEDDNVDGVVVENQVTVFPNPSSTQFTIVSASRLFSACQFTIKDLIGRNVYTSNSNVNLNAGIVIDCQKWMKGVYVINVISSQGLNYSTKIVKN